MNPAPPVISILAMRCQESLKSDADLARSAIRTQTTPPRRRIAGGDLHTLSDQRLAVQDGAGSNAGVERDNGILHSRLALDNGTIPHARRFHTCFLSYPGLRSQYGKWPDPRSSLDEAALSQEDRRHEHGVSRNVRARSGPHPRRPFAQTRLPVARQPRGFA